MLHERLLSALAIAPGGLTTTAITERVDAPMDPLSLAAVEATLLLSREVSREGDRWKLMVKGRSARLLAAIESYADSSGKKIFRLAAALSGLPVSEHPTEEELRDVLASSHGRFALLPNAMIKRNQ
jgi:hypothetical protein